MKIFLTGIWVIIFFLNIATHSFAEETIRIAIGEWPPFMSKDLKHYGILTHIVTESYALEGYKTEYGFFPWARAKVYAEEGTWDCSAGWAKTAVRLKKFIYSDSIMKNSNVFFHLKSFKFDWNTMDDLKGIPIGSTIEYYYGDAFMEAEKSKQILVQRAPSDELNFRKLLKGRIKLFTAGVDVGYSLLQKKFTPEENQLITHHSRPTNVDDLHLIFSNKNERNLQLIKVFNKGLKKLRKSGKYDQMIAASRRGEYLNK